MTPLFAESFVGKRVLAVMNHDDMAAWVIGTLVSVTDDGEFVIDTDDGRRYCWPLLHVEIAPVPGESRA